MKGFTLVEMLIVMAIAILLMGLGFISVSGLRESYLEHNFTVGLEDDLRYAQRAAMFMERGEGDNWVYGVGIDFRNIESAGTYDIFRWCSEFTDYSDGVEKMSSELPANGSKLPFNSASDDAAICKGTEKVIPIEGRLSSAPYYEGVIIKGNVAIVLFESMTGRAFFYDENGNLLNYSFSGDEIFLTDNPSNLHLVYGRNEYKELMVKPVSGMITIVSK